MCFVPGAAWGLLVGDKKRVLAAGGPPARTWGSQAAPHRPPAAVSKPERRDGPPGGSSRAPSSFRHRLSVGDARVKSGPSAAPSGSALRTLPPQEGALTTDARLAGTVPSGGSGQALGAGRGPAKRRNTCGLRVQGPRSHSLGVCRRRRGAGQDRDSAQGSPRPHVPCPAGSAVSRGTGLGRDARRRCSPQGVWGGRGRTALDPPRPCAQPAARRSPGSGWDAGLSPPPRVSVVGAGGPRGSQ